MNECNHDLAERETACVDGFCPICLRDQLAAKDELHAAALQVLERHHQQQLAAAAEMEKKVLRHKQALDNEKIIQFLAAEQEKHIISEGLLIEAKEKAEQQLDAERKTIAGLHRIIDGHDNQIQQLREQLTAAVEALEVIAENADHYADNYTEVESLRTELRGFAETARNALEAAKSPTKQFTKLGEGK